MKTILIIGRPASGKTTRIIELLNNEEDKSILFSLENPEHFLRSHGLKQTIDVCDSENLAIDEMIKKTASYDYKTVAIDSADLLPGDFNFACLETSLTANNVAKMVITAHLQRDNKVSPGGAMAIRYLCPEIINIPNK